MENKKRQLLAFSNASTKEINKDSIKIVSGGHYASGIGGMDNSCTETGTWSEQNGSDITVSCTQTW